MFLFGHCRNAFADSFTIVSPPRSALKRRWFGNPPKTRAPFYSRRTSEAENDAASHRQLAAVKFARPGRYKGVDSFGAAKTMSENAKQAVFQALHDARRALIPLLYQVTTMGPEYGDKVRDVAKVILACAKQDGDAALASIILDNPFQYAVNHSFNTGIAAALMAAKLDIASDEIEPTVCGALTMNLAIVALLDTMASGAVNITPLQKMSIDSHNKLSHKTLGEKKIKNREWLNTVMQHHERPEGGGPLGMRGDTITAHAKLVGVCDRYCAILAARAMRDAKAADTMLKFIVKSDAERDDTLAQIASAIGPYHPGTFVQLKNGEIAIVKRRGEDPTHPIVASLGKQGGLSIDTSSERDTKEDACAIVEPLDMKLGYNKTKLCTLWGYDAPVTPPPS